MWNYRKYEIKIHEKLESRVGKVKKLNKHYDVSHKVFVRDIETYLKRGGTHYTAQ